MAFILIELWLHELQQCDVSAAPKGVHNCSDKLLCIRSPPPTQNKIFKCSEATHANVTMNSLSNITLNHFAGTFDPRLSLLVLPAASLILLTGVIISWSFAGQPSCVESLSPVMEGGQQLRWAESSALILQGAASSLVIIAWWSQCSYS